MALWAIFSLIMAYTNLVAMKYLPFQEAAADLQWEEIDSGLQGVIATSLYCR